MICDRRISLYEGRMCCNHWCRFCFFTLLILILTTSPLWSQLPTATLNGVVSDPKDLAVAGAKVTLTNQGTGVSREAKTSSEGQYVFTELPPGVYTLRIEMQGFAPREYKDVRLEVGRAVTLDAKLELAQLGQQVSVSEAGPGLQLTQSEVQGLVTASTVENIPLNGRNFLELAFLLPGNRPATNFDPTKTNTLEVPSRGTVRGGLSLPNTATRVMQCPLACATSRAVRSSAAPLPRSCTTIFFQLAPISS